MNESSVAVNYPICYRKKLVVSLGGEEFSLDYKF